MSSFTGKVVIITGASSGIGRETAIEFASLGAKITITGRKEEALKETLHQCVSKGVTKESDINLVVGDVTCRAVAEQIVQTTVQKFGQIDVLVNNAGIVSYGLVELCFMEDYDKIMNVNTFSVVQLTQLCIPYLKATKGNVVNVSSVNGIRSVPNVTYYCMSKAAVDMFTQCLALELAPFGVRVNAVNPGVIRTEIQLRGGLSQDAYEKFLEKSKSTHALGRHGTVDEVSKVIAFLASDSASFMTGNLTSIDGGKHAMCPR